MEPQTVKESTYRSPPPVLGYDDDESLLSEASDVAVTTDNFLDDAQDTSNTAPMHLHALRKPARLTGSGSLVKQNSDKSINATDQTPTPRGRRSRSTSRPRSSSRPRGSNVSANSSRSTSPLTLASMENNNNSNNNNAASYLDPDILTDKLGFIDLDPPLPHEIRCGPLADKAASSGGLTPVNERLCEDTLEDCHAFTDLGYYKSSDAYSAYSGVSMPSVTHSCSLSGFGSNVSVGSHTSVHSRDTMSLGGASVQNEQGSVLGLGRLDEEDEDEGEEEK